MLNRGPILCCPESLRTASYKVGPLILVDLRTVFLDICKLHGDVRSDFRTLSGQDRGKEGEREEM